MKLKLLLFTLLLWVVSAPIYGQNSTETGLRIGGGVSTFFLTGGHSELKVFKPKVAVQLGGYHRIDFNKFFVQAELLWTMKGSDDVVNAESCLGKHLLHTNYLTTVYIIGLPIKNKLAAYTGLEVGFNVLNMALRKEVDIDLNQTDVSANIGFSYTLNDKIRIGLRYNHNFSTLSESSFTGGLEQNYTDAKLRQQAAFLTLNYRLSKKEE